MRDKVAVALDAGDPVRGKGVECDLDLVGLAVAPKGGEDVASRLRH
jgi:hypothetical protein